jgi:glyoxylase-like metal-dependent hydrolase (beta-lactamase superfamily II)
VLRRTTITIALVGMAGMSLALANTNASGRDTPQALAEAAYIAMGLGTHSSEETDQLRTLITKGAMKQWDPGGSWSVADPLKPDLGTAAFIDTWDRTSDSWRTEWVRPRFVSGTRNYTEVYTAAGGYVTGMDVNFGLPGRTIQIGQSPPIHTMSAMRLRALLREQARNQIVILMHEHPERLSSLPEQTSGGKSYPAVQYQDENGTFHVMFDPATHLPAVVRTRDFDAHMGDANYDAAYSDWRSVGSSGRLKVPFRIAYTLNGVNVSDVTVEQVRINESLPADTFAAPPQLEGQAPKPAAAERTPFQWILRRLASGFYLDSDALHMDEGSALALTDVGPNISLVTGGSHNALVVATDDSLVVFDAPGDDGLSKWIINAARQKYPGKSFRYVVLTHHHLDHTGGIRAYAAEGATIVVGKGDGDYFRKVLTAPQTLNEHGVDAVIPRIVEVGSKWSETVGGRVIEAYSLDNPHATGYLIPYVPDAKMAFQTDLWIAGLRVPSDPALAAFVNRSARAIVDGLQKAGVTPDKLAGGHGAVGDYADLVRYVE